jgi:hypothetical protein
MSLDALGNDPCSKLNTTSYPDLWIQPTASESETYPRIAKNGTTISMLNMLNTVKSKGFSGNVLTTPERNSSNRLLQFLSGAGIAGSNYGSLGSILLGSSTSPETIVDTYFIGANPNYATSYGSMFDKAKLSAIMTTLQTKG